MGRHTNDDTNSLLTMQYRFIIHRKNGNEFSDALFYYPDNSDQREEKIDRMPELRSAISDGVVFSIELKITIMWRETEPKKHVKI